MIFVGKAQQSGAQLFTLFKANMTTLAMTYCFTFNGQRKCLNIRHIKVNYIKV